MYWSTHRTIQGAELDGANQQTIASLRSYYYNAKGLALDVKMNRLYFVTLYRASVSYIDLDSSNHSVQTLIRFSYYHYSPFAIDVDEHYVYVTTSGWWWYGGGKVIRANKTRGDGLLQTSVSGLYHPRGIAVQTGNTTLNREYTNRYCT